MTQRERDELRAEINTQPKERVYCEVRRSQVLALLDELDTLAEEMGCLPAHRAD